MRAYITGRGSIHLFFGHVSPRPEIRHGLLYSSERLFGERLRIDGRLSQAPDYIVVGLAGMPFERIEAALEVRVDLDGGALWHTRVYGGIPLWMMEDRGGVRGRCGSHFSIPSRQETVLRISKPRSDIQKPYPGRVWVTRNPQRNLCDT